MKQVLTVYYNEIDSKNQHGCVSSSRIMSLLQELLTKGVLKMFYQMTLWDIPNTTSLQGSESGRIPSGKQVGQMTGKSGQHRAPVNLSARQAKAKGLMMSGTYGQHSIGLSSSGALALSLANKLRQKTDLLGSTLYKLTWKMRITPAGLSIPALRASVLRKSGKGFTGWPTPLKSDRRGSAGVGKKEIPNIAKLSGWQTPTTGGSETVAAATKELTRNHNGGTSSLMVQAHLSGWKTPAESDGRRGGTITENMTGGSLTQQSTLVQPVRLTASGKTLPGSSAEMESGGQLNPAFSRWLMGLPKEFCESAVTAMES